MALEAVDDERVGHGLDQVGLGQAQVLARSVLLDQVHRPRQAAVFQPELPVVGRSSKLGLPGLPFLRQRLVPVPGRARTDTLLRPSGPQWTWNNEPGLITSDHLLLFEAAVFDAAGQVVEPFAFDDEGQDEGRVGGGGGGDDARSRLADPDVVADGQFAHLVGHAALLEGPGRRLFLAVGPRAAAAPIHWRQLLLSVLCTELTNTRDCLYSMALTTVPLILSFFLLTPLQLVRLIHHSHETVSS